jgi:hypothetical protein
LAHPEKILERKISGCTTPAGPILRDFSGFASTKRHVQKTLKNKAFSTIYGTFQEWTGLN